MQPDLNFLDLISAIGVAQGGFLSALLYLHKPRTLANNLLATFILLFALLTAGDILHSSHLLWRYPHLFLVLDPLTFFLSPLLYGYVLALIRPAFRLNKNLLLHLLPGVLLYIELIPVYIQSAEAKRHMLLMDNAASAPQLDPVLLVAAGQMLVYLAAAWLALRRHSVAIRNTYSFTERVELRWLRVMTAVMTVIWLCFAAAAVLEIPLLKMVDRVLFPIAVYTIGYFGIQQPALFRQNPKGYLAPIESLPEQRSKENVVPGEKIANSTLFLPGTDQTQAVLEEELTDKRKYSHSTLTPDIAALYATQLVELMEKEQLYLNNELKLQDVANRLTVRAHYVSQVLNDNIGKSFFDFVNTYRVEEAKQRLQNPAFEHYTVLAIGLESGFNSKAAFNVAFKKHTNMTPSQFRRSIKNT